MFHETRWDFATVAAKSFYDSVWLKSVRIMLVRDWCTYGHFCIQSILQCISPDSNDGSSLWNILIHVLAMNVVRVYIFIYIYLY